MDVTGAETPIPAATLVVLRDTPAGPPELLMVERARTLVFAGGALVFPGGRVDPGDYADEGAAGPHDVAEAAHRVAAIRETIEEAGIAVGLDPLPGPGQLAAIRATLRQGASLSTALAEQRLTLHLDTLVPFARWLPQAVPHRIFDTRFYLAPVPAGAPPPHADAGESTRAFWATAGDVLAEADAGRATVIFPTRRNLERLARYPSVAEAMADARRVPVRTITPWVEERADGPHLCIPDDLGYPVTSQPLASAMRA
jgi:8-oxo-dGTP pyrophosphatase MutT (NUDIX family)